jgi:L-threonate 2-dehydrogenase
MILSASRAGAGHALREELEQSQPALLKRFMTSPPDMYPKSYRWVAEMDEIAQFAKHDSSTQAIYAGLSSLFEHLARDYEGDREQVNAIDAFLASVAVSAPWSRRQ